MTKRSGPSSRTSRRRLSTLTAALLVAISSLAASPSIVAEPPALTDLLAQSQDRASAAEDAAPGYRYVAMGDSYSSGEGAGLVDYFADTVVADPSTGLPGGCHRSRTAYPLAVAASQDLHDSRWVFEACSGAVLGDFSNDSSRWGPAERQPAQDRAITSSTRLVTFTIGGNDVGFEPILAACVGVLPTADQEERCSRFATAYATPRIRELRRALDAELLRIASAMAPDGLIVVGGYPTLFSSDRLGYRGDIPGYCTLGRASAAGIPVGISYRNAQDVNRIEAAGGRAITEAISSSNATLTRSSSKVRVVSTATLDRRFSGHRLCERPSSGSRPTSYLNGVEFAGTSTTPFRMSFHPNVAGQHAYGEAFLAAIGSFRV